MLKTIISRQFNLIIILLVSFQTFNGQSTTSSVRSSTDKLFSNAGSSDIDYLRAIERATEILETAEADTEFGVQELGLIKNIDQTKNHVDLILSSLRDAGPNIRNQLMYRTMFKELQGQLDVQNKMINLNNDKLAKIQKRIGTLKSDTVLMALVRDSVRIRQYGNELLGLKSRYTVTDSIIQSNMRTMTAKKRLVIDSHLKVENALLTVEKKLDRSGVNLLGEEYPSLWNALMKDRKSTPTENIEGKWDVEKNVVAYYIKYNLGGLLFLAIIITFIVWYVRRNIRYIKSIGWTEQLSKLDFKYLNKSFILSGFIIFLNIVIVTNLYSPALFIELVQLFLLIALTFLFKNQWSKKALGNWYYLCGLYILFCFVDLFVEVSSVERCIFITMNILSIRYGVTQFKKIKEEIYINRFFKWAIVLFIGLNSVSLILNISGRVSLSHTLSIAAIIALTQIIALSVLFKIAIEIIILQIFVTRIKRGIEKIFDHNSIFQTLKKPFTAVIIYMWFIVISSNLNIWLGISTFFITVLDHNINIGSVSFTIGGVLLFFVIIWIAHLIKNYVSYFFGEIDEEDDEHINKKQHSKLLITRLVVLISGYLLAVAASGMPMDKLSIIIGALGVGVGLGLQNIVTNFVSGIILIFDRPIQVGDIIDVNSQSGRVKSMGLRSTKINSPEGAEIIIPNGNILSQNITNWTYTDNLKQVEISFNISGTITTERINETINETVQSSILIDKKKNAQIFFNAVAEDKYTVLVKFWCSIYRTEEVLSILRQDLFINFKNDGFTITI